METLIQLFSDYGLETVAMALVINLLTGALKLPLKRLARRAEDSASVTRFVTFLPVVLGFGVTVFYQTMVQRTEFRFDGVFVSLWLSSSSLSLAVYAFVEKFFPSAKKVLKDGEIRQNEALIEKIQQAIESVEKSIERPAEAAETAEVKEETEATEEADTAETVEKIILHGGNHDRTQA